MKIFKQGNFKNTNCLICKTSEEKEVTLIPIAGTEEGDNMQALQIHIDCISLFYYPEHKIIAQKILEEKGGEKNDKKSNNNS